MRQVSVVYGELLCWGRNPPALGQALHEQVLLYLSLFTFLLKYKVIVLLLFEHLIICHHRVHGKGKD